MEKKVLTAISNEDQYQPKTAEEVYPLIYKTDDEIQEISKYIAVAGWKRASNVKGARKIGKYHPNYPKSNTGIEVFTRKRTIEEITSQMDAPKKDRKPSKPISLYRIDRKEKKLSIVPDCSALPMLSHFSDFESLVAIQSKSNSLVISCDTEFVSCLSEERVPLTFQFAVIDGNYLIEFIFMVCHPEAFLKLEFCLGFILDYLGLYEGVKGADIIRYTSCSEFRNGKPVTHQYSYLELDEARKSAKYKYIQGEFVAERIPKDCRTKREERDWGYFHMATDFTKVHSIPVTLLCHFGRIDISGFCDFERHMRKCSDVQGGTVTMKSYQICPECHSKESYWKQRDRNRYYPVSIRFSDTMCHAPAEMKKLENLGDVVGVPKVDLDKLYPKYHYIKHIHDLLIADPKTFFEYAGTDAVVTLLYASSLYGYNKELPVTLTSATARYLCSRIMTGLNVTTKEAFNRKYRGLKNVNRGTMEAENGNLAPVSSLEPISADAGAIQSLAKNAYHGGYNGCSEIGSYHGFHTYDYDICSAYSSIMAMIPDVDWESLIQKEITNRKLTLEDWKDDSGNLDLTKVGFFEVTFSFPDEVAYPCFCCMCDGVPVYPRSSEGYGSAYVSAQDIYLALQLGADVFCKRGYFCNLLIDDSGNVSYSLREGVVELIRDRSKAKKKYGKKSLEELILKVMVNSFYGKISQNVIDKRTWNAYYNKMESLGISSVTNPVSACMITSYIRCILLSVHNQLVKMGYHCYSVTTDGFISDVPHDVLDSCDLYGFRDFLLSARAIIGDANAKTCFEVKHQQTELLNFTTRGNVSLSEEGVCAHNSYFTGYEKDGYEDRKALEFAVLTRSGRCPYTKESAPKFKDILNKKAVPVFTKETRNISMDFDLKRKPIRETMHIVQREIDGVTYEICNFSTEPYQSVEEFELYRKNAEACRANGCLRTLEDWEIFFARLHSDKAERHIERHIKSADGTDNLAWKVLNSIIMGYRLGMWDIPYLNRKDLSVADKVAWINTFNTSGKQFTANSWKNCGKADRRSQMLHEEMLQELLMKMQQYQEETAIAENIMAEEQKESIFQPFGELSDNQQTISVTEEQLPTVTAETTAGQEAPAIQLNRHQIQAYLLSQMKQHSVFSVSAVQPKIGSPVVQQPATMPFQQPLSQKTKVPCVSDGRPHSTNCHSPTADKNQISSYLPAESRVKILHCTIKEFRLRAIYGDVPKISRLPFGETCAIFPHFP